MSRRGYPSSEIYEEREREREYYTPRRGGRTAEYDEIDIRERRRGADRQPDFLREDYGRSSNAGPLVLHEDKRSNVGSTVRNRDKDVVETDEVFISKTRDRDRPKVLPVEREEASYRRKKAPTEISEREEIIYRDRETYSPPPQQIAREREEFYYRPRERSPPQIAREHEEYVFRPKPREPIYEREEIIIRDGERERERPRERDYRDEEIIIRRDEKERERPRERERERGYEEDEIIIRREERERQRPKERERDRGYEQEEITIRERERERPRPRATSYERESLTIKSDNGMRSKSRDFREDDIIIRRGEKERFRPKSPEPSVRDEDIIIRRSERETPRTRSRERGYRDNELVIRERSRQRERSRGRDDEDIIIRHDENDRRHKDEIIIRRNERSPSPEPYVPPPPAPAPEPTKAPPIIQEIITHHRHIDHGFERAPAPAPPPPPPPAPRSPSPKDDFEQIEIRRRGERNGRHYDEDIIIDSGRREDRALRRRSPSPAPSRRPPSPAPSRRPPSPAPSIPRSRAYTTRDERDIAEEAEYYNERARERSYIGEGYNGATRDWAIVDVPPGTRRVEMEGIGGAHQEVTWQRYNGVRRSKFIAEDEPHGGELVRRERDIEIDIDTRDRGRRFVKEKSKTEGMWTEITKDLVSEEAIKEAGYEFEETEFFYYIMSYLRYEDVQALVGLSEDIKKGRRERIREMQYEREARDRPRKQLALPWDEERIVEREVIYDGPPPRRYR